MCIRDRIEEAQRYWNERGGAAQMSFEPGNALVHVPRARGAGDIYLLSAVLHGFDDDTAAAVLRNVAASCGSSGARIALMEMVAPETGTDAATAAFDMQMFMATRGRARSSNVALPRSPAGGRRPAP
jgi:hypothetical protein